MTSQTNTQIGGFGLVQSVKRKSSGLMFAKKIQNKRRIKASKALSLVFKEREALSSTKSPFVVGLHYAFQVVLRRFFECNLETFPNLNHK